MVAEVEIEIQEVADKSTKAEKTLEKGCDAYLDEALSLKERFEPIVNGLSVLNEHTMTAFDTDREEVYNRIYPKMQPLYDSCIRNIDRLKASLVSEALTTLIELFEDEADHLKENMEDIAMLCDEIPQDEEMQSLLSQL